MATILITGASGLIGSALSHALSSQGHTVHHLGRTTRSSTNARSFVWDPTRGVMDPAALNGVTHIVHLAGAGIADKRWSRARIQELITSRTETARLLNRLVQAQGVAIEAFVSAAGIGYYGARSGSLVFTEQDGPATDTIGMISSRWEDAVDEWREITRVVKLRTPVVLARKGGALPKLAAPVRLGLGAALGRGDQWMPWVHIDDLVRVYTAALFDARYSGAFNVNTSDDVTNDTFMRTVARVMDKPYFLPRIPAFLLRMALGELASVLLEGSRASNNKLLGRGFRFEHPRLAPALKDLLC